MSNKKQTAVEFLEQQIIRFHNWKLSPIYDENCVDEIELDKFIKQAKAMEKEQNANTWNNAINAVEKDKWESFEQYYKETYEL
jgi:hypothetical protein